MKKIFVCLLVLIMLVMAGCTKTSGSEEEADEWGITLSAENVTATSMTLVCTQRGGNFTGELHTGSAYAIEQLVDGEWLPVPTAPGVTDWAWTLVALRIQPNNTTKWDVNWEFLYGELGPGVYRIQKEIMDFRGPGDYTEKNYYAEFAIVD